MSSDSQTDLIRVAGGWVPEESTSILVLYPKCCMIYGMGFVQKIQNFDSYHGKP